MAFDTNNLSYVSGKTIRGDSMPLLYIPSLNSKSYGGISSAKFGSSSYYYYCYDFFF